MPSDLLRRYEAVVGERAIDHLRQLARPLEGKKIVHVNSTREGGGVAEILHQLVPLSRALGLDVDWQVITGGKDFYLCTKSMHNALQGDPITIPDPLLEVYEETNRANQERLGDLLTHADVVFIHDPQPAPLHELTAAKHGRWIWRCHIDLSLPHRPVWKYLERFVAPYSASIFSLVDFAPHLPHPRYLVPPSIDPFSEKNRELEQEEVDDVRQEFGLDPDRPLLVQVSRFDRFKDPVGVIHAYWLSRKFFPGLQLVLAGGTASDDPEGEEVLEEVRRAAGDDPNIHVLLLPPDAHRTINALQRAADVILQKSIREGFGLTVTEGMWKARPVIGGNVGGIRLQLTDHRTGYLVSSPEGAALRIRQLLPDPELGRRIGENAREFVRRHFLHTRLLREHLTAIHGVGLGPSRRLDLTEMGKE